MRIIRIFFSTFIFLLLFILMGIFLGREILLTMAVSDLKRASVFLREERHLANCQDGFSISPDAWGQLRFENERDYHLETVCSSFSTKPVFLEERQLPVFVKKSAGASGFIFNQEKNPSQITLTSFGKEITVYSENNQLYSGKVPELSYTIGPASSCQAFNYYCCREEVEKGTGELQSLATDCPKSCFKSCLPRPLVLSFNAAGLSLANNRMLVTNSGRKNTFTFVVSDGKQELFSNQVMSNSNLSGLAALKARVQNFIGIFSKLDSGQIQQARMPITTTIFFGDGQSYTTQDLQGAVDHIYTCNEQVCYFDAWIEASDARLTPSLLTELNRLTVIIND